MRGTDRKSEILVAIREAIKSLETSAQKEEQYEIRNLIFSRSFEVPF